MPDFQHHLLPLLSAVPFGLEFRANVEFGSASGRPLRLHFARPRRRRQPLPAVLYLFGGGWRGGSPDQGALLITMLAMRGYFAASIDYRLSHEARFPAQLDDCRLALEHVQAGAPGYGLDPERIGLWGISAGGHLAALLATAHDQTDGRPQPSGLEAVVTWSAPFDLLRIAEQQNSLDDPGTMSAGLIGGALAEHLEKARLASPHSYLPVSTPPFLILHGGRDRLVPPSEGYEMHTALQAAGGESTFALLPDQGHGLLGLEGLRRTLAFLDTQLRSTPTG